jgi:ribonucleoside-triphosphate reductase
MLKIKSIEPVYVDVLGDIEVASDTHSYILGNGIITHNTVSLLAGATPGVHYPISEYYIRRVRVANNHPLLPAMRDAGYNIEPAYGSEKTTSVIDFPIKFDANIKTEKNVTMWEKLELVDILQSYWSDNQVSCTITFSPEEAAEIPLALSRYESRLKSLSFLPQDASAYKQKPYEEITSAEYWRLKAPIKPINFSKKKLLSEDVETDFGCDGDKCELQK